MNMLHTQKRRCCLVAHISFYFVTLCRNNKHNKKLASFTVVCFKGWQCDFFIHEFFSSSITSICTIFWYIVSIRLLKSLFGVSVCRSLVSLTPAWITTAATAAMFSSSSTFCFLSWACFTSSSWICLSTASSSSCTECCTFKQHGLCASPLFLQTLGPWFPN